MSGDFFTQRTGVAVPWSACGDAFQYTQWLQKREQQDREARYRKKMRAQRRGAVHAKTATECYIEASQQARVNAARKRLRAAANKNLHGDPYALLRKSTEELRVTAENEANRFNLPKYLKDAHAKFIKAQRAALLDAIDQNDGPEPTAKLTYLEPAKATNVPTPRFYSKGITEQIGSFEPPAIARKMQIDYGGLGVEIQVDERVPPGHLYVRNKAPTCTRCMRTIIDLSYLVGECVFCGPCWDGVFRGQDAAAAKWIDARPFCPVCKKHGMVESCPGSETYNCVACRRNWSLNEIDRLRSPARKPDFARATLDPASGHPGSGPQKQEQYGPGLPVSDPPP